MEVKSAAVSLLAMTANLQTGHTGAHTRITEILWEENRAVICPGRTKASDGQNVLCDRERQSVEMLEP